MAAKLLLARISKHIRNSKITVVDYKGEDFSFLKGSGSERAYIYTESENAISDFFAKFQKRLSGEDSSRTFQALYIDEWVSYITNQDKKKAEEEKKMLGTMAFLARSKNMHLIVGLQRADSSNFSAGSRDQFAAISLGNMSEQAKEMLFSDYKLQIKSDRKQGTGYMLTDKLVPIVVPHISDVSLIDTYIKDAVNR